MAELREIVILDLPEVPQWGPEDQMILEWMFPELFPPPHPVTPDCPEPPRLRGGLQRSRALSRREWDELLSVV